MLPQGEAERAAAPNEDTHTVAPLDVRTKAPHELLLLPIVQSASLSLRPVATLHEEVVADGALARRMPPHGETVAKRARCENWLIPAVMIPLAVRARRRGHRAANRQCLHCGFDLRSVLRSHLCPECGEPFREPRDHDLRVGGA